MLRPYLLLTLIGVTIYSHPHHLDEVTEGSGKCGYSACPTPIPGKLNVHIVPHSHDDVGWLKTVDQYYYGSLTRIQNAGVQYIIDSVVQELLHDPKKKFIYVETAFFWKWWLEQDDHMRHQVKKLVSNGQLEFIGGAWSMNDEATTHYQSVIDQFTWGFRKLNDTFGYCGQPKVGWQIDPFGHARETASLMAQMGFDGLFFGRLDYQDKRERLRNKTMEIIWEGSDSLGVKADLMTSALYNEYAAPPGFCFDILCNDDPIIDNKKSPAFNVQLKVDAFLTYIRNMSKGYASHNLLVTMGEDFQYQAARVNYRNLDLLIRYVNQRQENGSDVNVFYSTPSCYLKSLNEANIHWPTKKDDFFPYASDQHAYWTGYFTSRPTIKYFERLGNNYLQITKQLAAVTKLGPDYDRDLNTLREAMGIMQHHDAITGTEKQHVANDYARILSEALAKCGVLVNEALNRLHEKVKDTPRLELQSCLLTNISECAVSSEAKNLVVTIYNPLSRPVSYFARIPVFNSPYSVRDPQGNNVAYDLVPVPDTVLRIPGRKSKSDYELVFKAESLPPLGYRSYFISKLDVAPNLINDTNETNETGEELPRNDEITNLHLDVDNGNVSFLFSSLADLKPSVFYYIGAVGNNAKPEFRSSGAYIFRPNGTEAKQLEKYANDSAFQGKIVTELYQKYSEWASHVIRQYIGEPYIEVEWLVGPIPISDSGKEVIWRYNIPDIDSNLTFYTDSNGRETIQRIKDYRPTWNVHLEEPIAGNYYPITTDISINDGDTELTVMVDRAQGGTSLESGQIELMVHRRLLHDDAFGVGEALNEVAFGKGLIARGQHWILKGKQSNPNWAQTKRHLRQQKILNSHMLFANADSLDFDTWSKGYNLEFSSLTRALPDSVQILTLEPWGGSRYLLRLEHLYEKTESQETVTINLKNLFTTFDITSIRETTLGANQWLDEARRMKWKKETNEVNETEEETFSATKVDDLQIKLRPKEIRTFICEIIHKNYSSESAD